MAHDIQTPPGWISATRIVIRLAVVVVVVVVVRWILGQLMPEDAAAALSGDGMMIGLLVVTLVAYAVLMAVPFVPGVEIGLSLLLFGGPSVAPLVYLATVIGLILAFAVGRSLSYDWLHAFFADLRLLRMCRLLEDLKPLSQDERLALLQDKIPRWATPIATKGRYVMLALLLVLPGNAVIGGGGGICLLAGVTRLYAWPGLLVTIALADLPIPLAVWAFDLDVAAFF